MKTYFHMYLSATKVHIPCLLSYFDTCAYSSLSVGCQKKKKKKKYAATTYDHEQKTLDTFAFLGCFPIHCTDPSPALTPKTNVGRRIFPYFQLCIGWPGWGRELQENFEEDAPFYKGTRKRQKNVNTALLS